MKKATYIVLTGMLMTQTLHAQGFRVRNQEAKKTTTETLGERDFRIKATFQARETGLKAESVNANVNLLSALTRGQTDATQLKAGLVREYQVEAFDKKANSSRMVIVKVADMVQKISLESQKIKETNENGLVGEAYTAFNARKMMVDLSAKLVGVAGKKYAGTDANLVIARDAFARLVETSTRSMDSNSGISAREISEHNRIIDQVVKAKEQNDRLTDAEAMMIGAQRAHEFIAAQAAKETGITNKETPEARAKRVQEYLKELKDCT